MHKPRPLTDGAEAKVEEALPFELLNPPDFNARDPKLTRLANGEVGDVPIGGTASPSSTALSSIEPDGELLLAMLPCRPFENGEVCVGEPARACVTEFRRRC